MPGFTGKKAIFFHDFLLKEVKNYFTQSYSANVLDRNIYITIAFLIVKLLTQRDQGALWATEGKFRRIFGLRVGAVTG